MIHPISPSYAQAPLASRHSLASRPQTPRDADGPQSDHAQPAGRASSLALPPPHASRAGSVCQGRLPAPMLALPDELLLQCMAFLPYNDLARLSRVCRALHVVGFSPALILQAGRLWDRVLAAGTQNADVQALQDSIFADKQHGAILQRALTVCSAGILKHVAVAAHMPWGRYMGGGDAGAALRAAERQDEINATLEVIGAALQQRSAAYRAALQWVGLVEEGRAQARRDLALYGGEGPDGGAVELIARRSAPTVMCTLLYMAHSGIDDIATGCEPADRAAVVAAIRDLYGGALEGAEASTVQHACVARVMATPSLFGPLVTGQDMAAFIKQRLAKPRDIAPATPPMTEPPRPFLEGLPGALSPHAAQALLNFLRAPQGVGVERAYAAWQQLLPAATQRESLTRASHEGVRSTSLPTAP